MFRGKRIISGIMLVLMLVSFIGCKRTSKAATFREEQMQRLLCQLRLMARRLME